MDIFLRLFDRLTGSGCVVEFCFLMFSSEAFSEWWNDMVNELQLNLFLIIFNHK